MKSDMVEYIWEEKETCLIICLITPLLIFYILFINFQVEYSRACYFDRLYNLHFFFNFLNLNSKTMNLYFGNDNIKIKTTFCQNIQCSKFSY